MPSLTNASSVSGTAFVEPHMRLAAAPSHFDRSTQRHTVARQTVKMLTVSGTKARRIVRRITCTWLPP